MIYCKELDRNFEDRKAMFRALKDNEQKLIDLKRSQVFKGCEKGNVGFLSLSEVKSIEGVEKAFKVEDDYIYPVISTTRYMDSHLDVHFDGCFGKTVKEQQGKVFYALDHDLSFNSIAAWPKDVEMFVTMLPWSMVGKDYEGETQALVFKIKKDAVRKDVLEAIEGKKADFENSIRMRYVQVKFAVNDDSKEFSTNKAYYDSRIESIANKEVAEEYGYFWGVEELGIYKEGSLVVRGGSNDATAIILSEADQKVTPEKQINDNEDPPRQSERKINLMYNQI